MNDAHDPESTPQENPREEKAEETPMEPAAEAAGQPTAEPSAGTAAGSLEAELDALRKERDALRSQLQRSLADLANIRRRHSKEIEQMREMAVESFARELLPVLDNFHLALEAHEQQTSGSAKSEAHALVEGLRMVRGLFEGVLERHGVREIEGKGHPFDPNKHEAVGVDATGDVEPGHISQVVQRGYLLSDRVLRPSRVIVRELQPAADQRSADSAGERESAE